jgi:hypothetical protein
MAVTFRPPFIVASVAAAGSSYKAMGSVEVKRLLLAFDGAGDCALSLNGVALLRVLTGMGPSVTALDMTIPLAEGDVLSVNSASLVVTLIFG